MSFQTIEIDQQVHVATVWLNRPDVRNAFNELTIAELTLAFHRLDQDQQVRVIVLAARGTAFCAGADLHWIKEIALYTNEENLADAAALADMMHVIYSCTKPVVARVQGDCYAGGIGLIAACDMVVSSTSAGFCLSEVRLGLIPATISPYVLRAIGERQARRYFLTAERFDAHEAKRINLIHVAVEDTELDHEVARLVHALLSCSPHAMDKAKRLIRDVSCATIDQELIADTVRRIADVRSSEQGREGVQAFLQKRKPTWLTDSTHDK